MWAEKTGNPENNMISPEKNLAYELFQIIFVSSPYITKTRPCNMKRFLKAVKMVIFRLKIVIFFLFLLKT